jgi:hypothetical protein
MSNNGKNGPGPTGPPPIKLKPEDIAHQVSVVITKDGHTVIMGELGNLPLLLHLLAQGVDIVGGIVSQRLPQRIIPVTGHLPPGVLPFGKAGE